MSKELKAKIYVICGKGGVGKSSVSSIYAKKLSSGYKVLLVSIDQDHTISIIFNREIGNRVIKLDENLYAIEIDASDIAKHYISSTIDSIKELITPKSLESIKNYSRILLNSQVAINTAIIYGLYKIEKNFDIIIIDTPPSFQFISFLNTLFSLEKNLDFVLKIYENWKRILENFSERKLRNYEKIRENLNIAIEIESFFKLANYYIVINPSEIVIRRSKSMEDFLKKHNLNFIGYIVNKYKNENIKIKNVVDYIPFQERIF
ncbi:MAG: ArsA-related P-loop ATPase [candidate division WOR-3 bacterium]|nr:arsenical pump-driving ATPase GET3 [candidate division WOR-3 bacterium]MDW8149821.1 ArsA-related P-loop ATPase [candidate division WOR-3 bacterium]